MTKYNLTFLQRLFLPFAWILWRLTPNRKESFHLVKKSMEPHTHDYSLPGLYSGNKYLKCSHEGCNMVDPEPFLIKSKYFPDKPEEIQEFENFQKKYNDAVNSGIKIIN